jgi:hypothetical protein
VLAPLASKLSVSPHAENSAFRPNGGTRAEADASSSTGPDPFEEALTSALRDASAFVIKARPVDSPVTAKQLSTVTTATERPADEGVKDGALAQITAASVAVTLSSSMPRLVAAALRKDVPDESRTIPANKKSEKDEAAQEKEPLPSPDVTSATIPDVGAIMPILPVNVPPPISKAVASATSRDVGAAQPVVMTPQQPALSSQDITMMAPDRSEAKETEAFSLHLDRKTTTQSSGSAAVGSPHKESKDAPEMVSQPSQPPPSSQSSKVTSPPVAGNSSVIATEERFKSSKFSGGNDGAEQRDKDEAPLPTPVLGDARESKQGFPDYSSSPALFVKDTGAPEQSRNAQALMRPAIVENQDSAPGVAKEVAIRLQNESGETINIKLVDQAGQVQVTVRSSDSSTAASLREDLSSLTNSLEKVGWKSEVSLPVGTSFEPVNETRHADRESQDTPGQHQADWQQETPKKRYSSTDAWDEMLTNQTV